MTTQEHTDATALAYDVASSIAQYAIEIDRQGRFPKESLEKMKESGLMGLLIPHEFGGMQASYHTMSKIAQILASSCLSSAMIWSMHCQQVATIVDHAETPIQQTVLPRIAKGQMYLASVTTEVGKGGHLLTALSPLVENDNFFSIERIAPVVTGGAFGDAYLITMRASQHSSPADIVLVFAERTQLECATRSGWKPMGMRGTDSVGLTLKGHIPSNQVIHPSGGFEQVAVTTMIPVGHIAWSSCWLGAAQGAVQQLLALLHDPKTRKSYHVQSEIFLTRLARVRMQIDTVSVFLQQTIVEYEHLRERWKQQQTYDVPRAFHLRINSLKVLASELLFEAVHQLVQLAGLQYGYLTTPQSQIERVFRDLRSASLMYNNDRLLLANGKLSLLDGR